MTEKINAADAMIKVLEDWEFIIFMDCRADRLIAP